MEKPTRTIRIKPVTFPYGNLHNEGTSALPLYSHSSALDTYYHWLKEKVQSMEYGEVGLSFIIHNGQVVRIKKSEDQSCMIKE